MRACTYTGASVPDFSTVRSAWFRYGRALHGPRRWNGHGDAIDCSGKETAHHRSNAWATEGSLGKHEGVQSTQPQVSGKQHTPPTDPLCGTTHSELNLPQVLDEADRLLDMDFGLDIDAILKAIPKERTTYLFSATMTTKVAKLQRASLNNPVRVEVSTKYALYIFCDCNLISVTQVFHGVHLAAILSFHTTVTKRRSPRLSGQFTGSKFHYSLHTDSS